MFPEQIIYGPNGPIATVAFDDSNLTLQDVILQLQERQLLDNEDDILLV